MIEPPANSRPILAQTDTPSRTAKAQNERRHTSSMPLNTDQALQTTETTRRSEPLPQFDLAELLAQGSNTSVARLKPLIENLHAIARKLDPHAQQTVMGLRGEAQRLVELAQALQELDQLQRGATSLRFESLELGDLLMGILPKWKQRAPQHALELALPGEIPGILAATRYAERAIDLLIEAAVALAPRNSTIRVSIRPQVDDVLVTVQFSGPSLSEHDIQHLFDPFYQPEHALALSVCGGVGLALARALLLAHGGRIWAQCSSGQQEHEHDIALAAAWPLVPAPPAHTESSAQPSAASSPPTRERLAIATQRAVILVLDSDSRMLRYLRANLDMQGYKPVLAKDADEVRRLIDLEEPDLLLLDLHTLGAEQPEAVDEFIQELQALVVAPVICLARHNDPLECARLLDLGASDYLAKPFSLEELLARIRVALRTREATASASAREMIFRSGDLTIDFSQRHVMVGDRPIALSKTEFKLLRVLAEHAGMVLAHDVLLNRVWGLGYSEEIEFVWVYIRRLRKKIEPDPSAPTYIQTVPGVGYRLVRL